MVSWGCWAEQPQSCSSSLFEECHFLVLTGIGVRVTLLGRRPICRPIVFGQNALMPMVQGLEGRPLWGRAGYTALHGARLSSVPSGDQSANPASVPGRSGLQRALLLSLFRSASGHRASHSKYTRDQSQETGSLSKSSGGVGAPAKRVLLGPA